jgi:hypothetical protein
MAGLVFVLMAGFAAKVPLEAFLALPDLWRMFSR